MTTPCSVPEHSSALSWALDSVLHNPGKQPSCHSFSLLRHLRRIDSAQIHQSRLCYHLDTTSTRPASTPTSAAASGCFMPRRRGRSGVTLLVSTKRTANFLSQVNSSLKTCYPSAPLTFTRKSTAPPRLCLPNTTFDLHSQVNSRCASKCTSHFHLQVNSSLKTC